MTVSKLTNNVKPLDEVDKINEIIDELGSIVPLPSQTGQSGKYLTTNGTVPSWAEVQSLPSQTGKAGLYLHTDGTDASWEGVPGRNIGEIVASTIPLTDAGLHLLDGSLILGNGIYSDFVDYIAGIYGPTANYFCTEVEWQTAVTTYGVCGKFVYDSVNNTVRLPKYNSKIYTGGGTAPVVGNGMTLGLTNGTDNGGSFFENSNGTIWICPGIYGNSVNNQSYTGSALRGTLGVTTDPTKSGIIAQLSDITTSLDGYYYIVIATSTKTDIQVDIDEIATDLNGKADVDLSNCTKPHIIETYSNGASWYRVYSDGWCEQGGLIVQNSNLTRTINLLKSYSNTDYICIVCAGRNTSTGDGYGYIGTRNTDSFQCVILDVTSINACWQASGYIN